MMDQSTLEEGLALKERGQRLAEFAEDPLWNQRCDAAIIQLARSGRSFTCDDACELAGRPSHPNALGARFSAAKKAGIIRGAGYQMATRPERHGSVQKVWVGA